MKKGDEVLVYDRYRLGSIGVKGIIENTSIDCVQVKVNHFKSILVFNQQVVKCPEPKYAPGFYHLTCDGEPEPVLVYGYHCKDEGGQFVFGYNTHDGGGLVLASDLCEDVKIKSVTIEEVPPPSVTPKAPWTDFNGKDIYMGDKIIHPSGNVGKVKFYPNFDSLHDQWRVQYDHGLERMLHPQIVLGKVVVVDEI